MISWPSTHLEASAEDRLDAGGLLVGLDIVPNCISRELSIRCCLFTTGVRCGIQRSGSLAVLVSCITFEPRKTYTCSPPSSSSLSPSLSPSPSSPSSSSSASSASTSASLSLPPSHSSSKATPSLVATHLSPLFIAPVNFAIVVPNPLVSSHCDPSGAAHLPGEYSELPRLNAASSRWDWESTSRNTTDESKLMQRVRVSDRRGRFESLRGPGEEEGEGERLRVGGVGGGWEGAGWVGSFFAAPSGCLSGRSLALLSDRSSDSSSSSSDSSSSSPSPSPSLCLLKASISPLKSPFSPFHLPTLSKKFPNKTFPLLTSPSLLILTPKSSLLCSTCSNFSSHPLNSVM